MKDLPDDVLKLVVGYLPPLDALQLNNTCKIQHSKLSLTATSPRKIITEFSRFDRDDDGHYGFQIPVPHQVECHSVLLSMKWRDQGWGNRKGRVFVIAEEQDRLYDRTSQNFGGGRHAYTSEIALHIEQTLSIEFKPKANETYHLWYAVGGGGGHSLKLSSVKVQALVFDSPLRPFGKACNFLSRPEVLPAWDEKEGRNFAQLALPQGEHLLAPLISFVGDREMSESEKQMIMGYSQSLWDDWLEELIAYEKIMDENRSLARQQFREAIHQVDDFLEDQMDFGEFVVRSEG